MCVCVSESWSWLFLNASDMRSLASTKLVQTSHCDDVREWLMHDKTETGGAVCACVRACVRACACMSMYQRWGVVFMPLVTPNETANLQTGFLNLNLQLVETCSDDFWRWNNHCTFFVYRKYDYKVYTYFCSFLLTFILDFRCP